MSDYNTFIDKDGKAIKYMGGEGAKRFLFPETDCTPHGFVRFKRNLEGGGFELVMINITDIKSTRFQKVQSWSKKDCELEEKAAEIAIAHNNKYRENDKIENRIVGCASDGTYESFSDIGVIARYKEWVISVDYTVDGKKNNFAIPYLNAIKDPIYQPLLRFMNLEKNPVLYRSLYTIEYYCYEHGNCGKIDIETDTFEIVTEESTRVEKTKNT